MALVLDKTDEITQLTVSVGRLLREQADFEARTARLARDPPDPMAMWVRLNELGVLSVLAPEVLGGVSAAPEDVAALFEVLAPALLPEPYLATLMALRALAHCERVAEGFVSQTLCGDAVVVIAHQESFDALREPTMRATEAGEGVRLAGVKCVVRHGDVATDFLVSARTRDGSLCLLRCRRDAPGLQVSVARTIDGAGAADLKFENVLVSEADILSRNASRALQEAFAWGVMALCVESAAIAETVNRETFAYLQMRQQFGQKLAQFQALQHRAADMAIAEQEAAAMAVVAIMALNATDLIERESMLLSASLSCDASVRMVTHAAAQLFGGMGVSDELAISHYLRRAAAIRTQLGGADARAVRLVNIESGAPA